MLEIRKYRLSFEVGSQGYNNEDGDWISGPSGEEISIPCNALSNGSAKTVAFPDGTAYIWQWEVTMDVDAPSLPNNVSVKLYDSMDVMIHCGIVKAYSNRQLSRKVWL